MVFLKGFIILVTAGLSALAFSQGFTTVENNQLVTKKLHDTLQTNVEVDCATIWTVTCIWPNGCDTSATATGFVANNGCDIFWNQNVPDKTRGCGYTESIDGQQHAKWYDFDEQGCPGRVFLFGSGEEYEVIVH
ncbi:hypothetical protein [Zooshikella harenae]|uniref:Uncharacterized protein n=1 Tax=Zooshikella harenae TaxID=2827238 RepID=A0ABS5ZD32_9GAMM|nr:hypothetical protein [Zooshikella harenae]MBU2710847.1 hypothetical protein [Zooshikella harenae]